MSSQNAQLLLVMSCEQKYLRIVLALLAFGR